MIELYQLPPLWGLQNFSPACMKLETWLRIAEIPYEAKPADMSQAPKGKVPYIRDQGVFIGDSTLIIDHIKKAYGKDPDQGLSDADRAVSLSFRRLMKENFYWVISYSRWVDDQNWPVYRKELVSALAPAVPEQVGEQIGAGLRAQQMEQLRGHGMGRHSGAEIRAIGIADLGAIADFLGAKAFFMADHPTTADAAVYAYVASMIDCPLPDPVKDYAFGRENLVAYTRRMRARFFPEKSPA
jgi:glutathione S-transferase